MFESIFTSTSENRISISQSMLGILVAVVIGLVIAFKSVFNGGSFCFSKIPFSIGKC